MPRPPRADRPFMPEYGIAGPKAGRGLLRWSWAVKQLTNARKYWLVTANRKGAPHAMPIWCVWHAGALYFSTGAKSRKAKNLAARPDCVICPELDDATLVVEGRARKISPNAVPRAVYRAYPKKYPPWELDPKLGPIFAMRPRKVIGFREGFATKQDLFTKTATRWRFR